MNFVMKFNTEHKILEDVFILSYYMTCGEIVVQPQLNSCEQDCFDNNFSL